VFSHAARALIEPVDRGVTRLPLPWLAARFTSMIADRPLGGAKETGAGSVPA
jgi:hypothetical protein